MIRVIPHGPILAIDSTSFSPVLREECRRVPGMSWQDNLWVGYPDAISLVMKRSRARGLKIIEAERLPAEVSTLPVAEKDLRDYQVEGVRFLLAKAREGALLADDLGLGKTVQAIRTARALRAKTVVICPSFVREVWVDEIKKWWPGEPEAYLPIGTKPGPISNSLRFVVAHYDIAHAWVPALIEWGFSLLVLDECQYTQNERARRTQACAALRAHAVYAIGLSGTPMVNRPKDLWAVVDTLSPGRFGKFFGYALKHCAARKEQVTPTKAVWKFDGASDLDELKERLGGFMLRRLKSDVKLQLPARQRQIIEMEIPKSARVSPSSFGETMRADKVLRAALASAADAKIPQVIELVIGHLEAGHKVVVGAHRKAVAQAIHDGVRAQLKSITSAVLTGEVPTAKRHALIKGRPDLTCCTLDSTSVGISLSYASVGVVAEPDYVPSKLTQWEGRFGREPGKNVLIQYALARGTLDEVVKRAVVAKLGVLEGAIGKNDDALRADLEAVDGPSGVAKLRSLFERLAVEDD